MSDKIKLPPQVKSEIDLYLAEGETILEAIPSTTGSVGKLGELWMLLTDRNVLFFTCEYHKDPVVALIGRKELKAITYEPHPVGITLTFVSRHRPQHPTRIAFLRAQGPLVNRFCEELSKDAAFEVITPDEKTDAAARPGAAPTAAVKPGSEASPASSPPVQNSPAPEVTAVPTSIPTAPPVPPASSASDGTSPVPASKTESVHTASPPPLAAEKKVPERTIEVIPPPPSRPPEVRISTTLTSRPSTPSTSPEPPRRPATPFPVPPFPAKPLEKPPTEKPPVSRPATVSSDSGPATPSAKSGSGVKMVRSAGSSSGFGESGSSTGEWVPEFRFVVFSTVIALVVGFIWYRLFEAIGDSRTRR